MPDVTKLESFAVLPLRNIVVFPHMVVPLFVGREKSVRALERVMKDEQSILLVTQKDPDVDEPSPDDLYTVGVLGAPLQMLKLPDGTMKVLIEGKKRVQIRGFTSEEAFYQALVEPIPVQKDAGERIEILMQVLVRQFEQYAKLNRKLPSEIMESIARIEDPSSLADTIAQHLTLKITDKQALLEMSSIAERLRKVFAFMESEMDLIQTEKRIRSRVKKQMEKSQREYYLNEQIKAIQKELGEDRDNAAELSALKEKIAKTRLSREAKAKAEAEFKRLRSVGPMSAEATVMRNYLDWLLSIPWKKYSRVSADLKKAQEILDADHYGLEKVKERILEYLAVQTRIKKIRGPILCLVGPPGVGKTSLARSIAHATGRKFARMSLGGVRDEAEIRGHRRTYVGSLPGRLIQGMKKAGASNPVFLLDEVDKLGADWRGDPSSALLEVLDPAQNHAFNDHYLEVDYDLSHVLFITTANTLNMPQPLRDRMEVVRIPGYTEDEKIEIAKRHLIPRQMRENGLATKEWSISDAGLCDVIRYYTREAGVRNLEREISSLCRKAIRQIVVEGRKRITVTPRTLPQYAGVRKFRYGETENKDLVGVVTGLAWTEVGGELLNIEAVRAPGKGKVIKTGKLGDVMQESILAAESYVKSRAASLGIRDESFSKTDIHLHVPEGATPKDGPSAGVAMVTAIVSVLTDIPVRRDVAMTGEITLRGRILPIGGLKEKLLAALRGGVKTVFIPEENRKDLAEVPDNVKQALRIVPVSNMETLLKQSLTSALKPVEWSAQSAKTMPDAPPPVHGGKKDHAAVVAH